MEFPISAEELSFIVGIIGNIVSFLYFLSPINTFRRIVKERSTSSFESFPYICTLLNTSLWTYYGITSPDGLLVATINGAGCVIEAIYVLTFLIFAAKETRVRTAIRLSIAVGFFVVVFFITSVFMQVELRIEVVGIISAILNVLMYSSPLAIVRTVLMTKSIEFMPFSLSFFLFLNGGIWAFYAFLVQDLFLGIPNGLGFVLGVVQIVIYCYTVRLRALKEGQHEQLLPSVEDF
ncbi:hypothetical protein ACHQM5_015223 [Ranunculus cassubicifolius]